MQTLKLSFLLILKLVVVACVAGFSSPATSYAIETPRDFTGVAKKAIPSVVSIKVRGSSSKQNISSFRWDGDSDDTNTNDLFNDQFFQRFFGQSPRRNSQERTPVTGQASGFIVSSDGIILTNQHVIDKSEETSVILNDGREFTAKVLGQDPNTDIALLKIDAKDLPALVLGDSDQLEVGQWVVAIGNPLGLQASLTAGIVSAKGRNNLDLNRIEDYIQTDAAINRGNSGGPLLDLNGKVIGINTAIVTNLGGGGYMGIGFAIPSNMAKLVMEQLLSDGSVTRGFLGLTMQAVDSSLAQAFGLQKVEGALVTEVVKGTPADKAGLKQGDVILKYENHNVSNIAGLRNAIAMMKPGSKIVLSVLRDNKQYRVPVEIGTFPTTEIDAKAASDRYGFVVNNLTHELAQKHGYKEEKGVVISKIEPGSPAAWAGLRQGALIMAVNQQPINSIDDYNKIISQSEKNKPILFLIKQNGVVQFLSLKIG